MLLVAIPCLRRILVLNELQHHSVEIGYWNMDCSKGALKTNCVRVKG